MPSKWLLVKKDLLVPSSSPFGKRQTLVQDSSKKIGVVRATDNSTLKKAPIGSFSSCHMSMNKVLFLINKKQILWYGQICICIWVGICRTLNIIGSGG